jgi:hypothetical protein
MVGYAALGELVPIFPVYALLFVAHGLSGAQVSSLFVAWSVTTMVLEVPSGVIADLVPRRLLLVVAAVVNGAGYALWVAWPSYPGFFAGFLLWGISSALQSGTFEALVFDELDSVGQAHRCPQVLGWSTAAALTAASLATLAAAPLIALGGIELTGWVSAGACGAQALVAGTLPRAARRVASDGPVLRGAGHLSPARPGAWARRYLNTLRTGLAEATTAPRVRRAVLLVAALYGFLAFDEYFGLVFADLGASDPLVAVLFAVTAGAQALGGVLAGPADRLSSPALGCLTAASAVALGAGALSGLWPAAIGIALGYGALQLVLVLAQARLQATVTGPARATVTSVAGLGSEVLATTLYVGFGLGSLWLGFPVLVAVFATAPLLLAALVPGWLPPCKVPLRSDVPTGPVDLVSPDGKE